MDAHRLASGASCVSRGILLDFTMLPSAGYDRVSPFDMVPSPYLFRVGRGCSTCLLLSIVFGAHACAGVPPSKVPDRKPASSVVPVGFPQVYSRDVALDPAVSPTPLELAASPSIFGPCTTDPTSKPKGEGTVSIPGLGAAQAGSSPSPGPAGIPSPTARDNHSGQGNLDARLIRQVIRDHIGEVKSCYEPQLAKMPNLQGRMTVRFTIAASGQVVAAALQDSTMGDALVESCTVATVHRWQFPELCGRTTLVVSYPFVLSPGRTAVGSVPGSP